MADCVGFLSPDLRTLRDELGQALDSTIVQLGARAPSNLAEIVDWADGRGDRARRLAERMAVPFRPVSIGPLRSLRPARERPLSLAIAGRARKSLPAASTSAAEGLALWRRLRLSWRNDGRDLLADAVAASPFELLVVAPPPTAALLERIARDLARHPGRRLVCVADSRHPAGLAAAVAGSRAGRLIGAVAVAQTNPHALFDRAERVHAEAGSDLGRDAMLAGAPLTPQAGAGSAGDPDDPLHVFRRDFLDGVVYLDPWRPRLTGFDTAAEGLAWLRDRFLENDRPTICVGISRWKRKEIRAFLDGPDGPPRFHASPARAAAEAARRGGRVVAWETRMPAGLPGLCRAAGVPLLRMEDGFLRSVGLGAAFRPGASTVLDGRGIYYDPRGPSDLTAMLSEAAFTPAQLDRARALARSIVELRLSKYNVGQRHALDDWPRGRTIVLVPGQVEDDASVMFGSPVVRTNLALLMAARRLNADAFVVFKPHPDVAAGLRKGRVEDADSHRFADTVVTDVSIADLLDRADAVETMTSLTGFEALLRGRRVGVHGQPFYAGWGLTEDRHLPAGRGRQLTLDELVAGALIVYPRYLDPVGGLRCEPELLVERLAQARAQAEAEPASAVAARARYVRLRHALLGPLATLLRRARGAVKQGRPPG